MALTRLFAKYAGKGTPNAPKGSVKGKAASSPGHPVRGKGTKNAPKGGTVQGSSPSNGSPRRRGPGGVRTSAKGNYGKAGKY